MSAHVLTDTTPTTLAPASVPGAAGTATAATAAAGTTGATAPSGGPAAAGGGWWSLSAGMTAQVATIADREDLVVTIAPGAGRGAPACFLPALAAIEIDGTHLGPVDPATAVPHRVSDRARYPVAWGLLTHEAAHARHSSATPPPAGTPAKVAAAAEMLEESRIEAAHLARRPDDRYWLRACASRLLLADTGADDPARAPRMTPWDAGQAAALVLARVTAGVLSRVEAAPVSKMVREVLGTDTVRRLRRVWQRAQRTADGDTAAMVALGQRWCEILGVDPTHPDPTPPTGLASGAAPGTAPENAPGSGSGRSRLAQAVRASASRVARAVAREAPPVDPAEVAATARAAAEAANQAAARDAQSAAGAVFTDPGSSEPSRPDTWISGTRPPTAAERTAARQLARALSTAGVRERVATRTSSPIPPGRLRMRGALAADAQRAAGAVPTAEPFTRVTRRAVPAPPLRLGIACDVSGSMSKVTGPVASAAWILAHAAAHLTTRTTAHAAVAARTATVVFGREVEAITRPDTTPTAVMEFTAAGSDEDIATALDALDGALELSRPGAARLVVIVSDGLFRRERRRAGQVRVDRLRAAGCGVLWLAPHGLSTPLDGATVHILTDPATAAQTIGRAATTALRTT